MTNAGSGKPGKLEKLSQKLWNTSPGSLTRAIQRRLRDRRTSPDWHTVKAGPAAGAKLFLPRTDEGAWKEMAEGSFDLFLYEALRGIRDLKGATCWDVGAHVGYHSLGFASLGAEVLAFEPNEHNARYLRMHLEKNPGLAPRIRHLAMAVADHDGELTFVQSADIGGQSSGSHLGDALAPLAQETYANFQSTTVPAVRIDTLIEQRGEKPPDILKIDVEGAEALVLRGGAGFFAERKPTILMEVHHIRLMHEVQELLTRWGYQIKILDEEHLTPSRCFILAHAAK